jgi:hypothetical protein
VPDVRDIALQMQRAFDAFARLPRPEAAVPVVVAIEAPRAKTTRPRVAAPAKVPVKARPKLRVVAKAPVPARAARQTKVAG